MDVSGRPHPPATLPTGNWVGDRSGVDTKMKKKISCPSKDPKPGRQDQSVTILTELSRLLRCKSNPKSRLLTQQRLCTVRRPRHRGHGARMKFGLPYVLRSAFFWDITRRRVVTVYRRFGTTYRSHHQHCGVSLKSSLPYVLLSPDILFFGTKISARAGFWLFVVSESFCVL
jgi:hypothetical protein